MSINFRIQRFVEITARNQIKDSSQKANRSNLSRVSKFLVALTTVFAAASLWAQGQGSWGGASDLALLIFWTVLVVGGAALLGVAYVTFLVVHELLGSLTGQRVNRAPALILTIALLLGLKVLYTNHKETQIQEALIKKKGVEISKVGAAETRATQLRKHYGIARAYMERECPPLFSRLTNPLEPVSGVRLPEGIWEKDQLVAAKPSNRGQTSIPRWANSKASLTRSMVRADVPFVESGYLRIARLSWWEKHPEAKKRELAERAKPWVGTAAEEAIVGLEDIKSWATYQMVIQDVSTQEDTRHWTYRIQLAVERIDSGARVAEHTGLLAHHYLEDSGFDELGLPLTCTDTEEKYKTTEPGEKHPHWDPVAYFFKEVIGGKRQTHP